MKYKDVNVYYSVVLVRTSKENVNELLVPYKEWLENKDVPIIKMLDPKEDLISTDSYIYSISNHSELQKKNNDTQKLVDSCYLEDEIVLFENIEDLKLLYIFSKEFYESSSGYTCYFKDVIRFMEDCGVDMPDNLRVCNLQNLDRELKKFKYEVYRSKIPITLEYDKGIDL